MVPIILLLLLTAVRLLVAAVMPLAPDEAYYWVWSRTLQAGYLDHPPMVALWIRAGTAIAGETAFGVRLLAPLAGLAGSVMLADAADRLFPGRRLGVPAAALLNATLMVGAGAVTMTPDTPLLFFTVATIWALARTGESKRWWLAACGAIGGALCSKYTGVLLGVAVPLWLAWARVRGAFRSAWLWAGGALASLLFLPVILWNAGHGWASFLKQGGRTGDWAPQHAMRYVPELIGAQIGLATPVISALFALGMWQACAGAARREPSATLLAALTLPGLLLFLQHAFGARVQGNWLAIFYPALAVAAAAAGARWWRAGCGLGLAMTALVYLQATAHPLPLPRKLDPTLIRLAGWDALARNADALRREQGLAFLASEDYSQASELAWLAPRGTKVVGAERRWDLFRLPQQAAATGLLLISDKRGGPPDPALWSAAQEIGGLVRARAGVEAERFRVYRVTMRAGAPSAVLPRPGGE